MFNFILIFTLFAGMTDSKPREKSHNTGGKRPEQLKLSKTESSEGHNATGFFNCITRKRKTGDSWAC